MWLTFVYKPKDILIIRANYVKPKRILCVLYSMGDGGKSLRMWPLTGLSRVCVCGGDVLLCILIVFKSG